MLRSISRNFHPRYGAFFSGSSGGLCFRTRKQRRQTPYYLVCVSRHSWLWRVFVLSSNFPVSLRYQCFMNGADTLVSFTYYLYSSPEGEMFPVDSDSSTD
ncbi:unnamed protein product [Pylaiella littoralis]